MSKSVKKTILVVAGSLSLALGIVGVFLPVLPTTPFLLLASFFYVRSSNRLYVWLINHKLFGLYIYNYMNFRAVKKLTKVGTILFLWLSILLSIYLVENLHLKLFLVAVGIAVSVHLFMLKTLSKVEAENLFSTRNKQNENNISD